ncbi:type I-U CRISPR-associated protein Cas8c [Pseudorhodoplanes sp.]|uniref:type I-G CRISPR-associated protein Cas8g2 n=1 Tax=Pseudorhodoplanes sp. TaxID=1934341 RepID=UPI00391CD992
MAEHAIPVDLHNPGQVFACLGFLEAADVLLGDAEGGFDWSNAAGALFKLRANGNRNPFEVVLEFLANAEVSSVAPPDSKYGTEKWEIPTKALAEGQPFPIAVPPSPATLPALLVVGDNALTVDHWGDSTDRDNVKFWAGSGGYPGAALMRDALSLVRGQIKDAVSDPFALAAPQSSSFRFDWRRDYIPMDVGFSPNEHDELTMVGFPLVEILAAIGLTNARPKRINKLKYQYGVVAAPDPHRLLSPIFLRAALGGSELPFPRRLFHMELGWPGQENQARCITDVIEENRL